MISSTADRYPLIRRIRAFCFAAIAIAFYYAARAIALHAAAGLASADWFDLTYRLMVLFLVLVGYGVMAFTFQRQRQPFVSMGLIQRPGWTREFGLGAALGWGALLVSVLPVVLIGGLYANIWTAPRQWFLLAIDAAVILIAALTEELVFRGYPFQRLIDTVGPGFATFLMALLAAVLEMDDAFAPRAGIFVAFLLSWLLCLGYLRTRALWLPFGFRFAWYASMGLLFGLPIGGISRYSPVIQSTARGPEWLTGGDYGPEAALVTALVLIAAFYFLLRTTREYAHKYAVPEIIPAGIPVDIDAIARRQHEAGIGPVAAAAEAAEPRLVQIGGALPPQGPPQLSDSPPFKSDD
jgi:membrane protease YdiL (CAAX protease family)